MPVGQEIICFCSSCNMELRHVVVAHKSGNSGPIAKVKCNTCAKIHAFRASPTEKSAASALARKAKKAPREKPVVVPIEVEWRDLLRRAEGKGSKAYATTGDFVLGDVIDHPSFGAGVVKSVKDGDKLDVIFQNDVKTLKHRLKAD